MTTAFRPAPIALFIYNRPEHTARTLAALAVNSGASDSDLVIFADGPKKSEHKTSVIAAREVARTATGFKSVRLVERESNMGLANSIIAGVSELCEHQGRVIAVEDDLVVSPEFLNFLNDGLERYEKELNVFQVSGYMFPVELGDQARSLFLPLISCWGWATWRRAWQQFDASASGYTTLKRDAVLRDRFNLGGSYDYFRMLQDQVDGKIDSWGVRWLLSVFLKDGLVLYPSRSLVENTGVDGSGTHGDGVAALQRPSARSTKGFDNFVPPSAITIDQDALEKIRFLLGSASQSRFRQLIRRLVG